MEDRLLNLNLEPEDNEGRGDCFFLSIGHGIGKTATELWKGVANQMRENENVKKKLGNFDKLGGFKKILR